MVGHVGVSSTWGEKCSVPLATDDELANRVSHLPVAFMGSDVSRFAVTRARFHYCLARARPCDTPSGGILRGVGSWGGGGPREGSRVSCFPVGVRVVTRECILAGRGE